MFMLYGFYLVCQYGYFISIPINSIHAPCPLTNSFKEMLPIPSNAWIRLIAGSNCNIPQMLYMTIADTRGMVATDRIVVSATPLDAIS